MKRYWVSWWSGNYKDEGCTKPPFQAWITGYRERENYGMCEETYRQLCEINQEDEYEEFLNENVRDDCSFCAVIDANSENEIWASISKYYPDYEQRFCDERKIDFNPGERFLDFENRTSLNE